MTDTELASDLVVHAARLVRAVRRELELPAGIRILSLLDELGPRASPQLAAADRCSQPTMSAAVRQLVEQGWVDQGPQPRRRPRHWSSRCPTAVARELARGAPPSHGDGVAAPGVEHARRHLTTEDLATAVAVLRGLLDQTRLRGHDRDRPDDRPADPRRAARPARSSTSRAPSGPSPSPASSPSWASAWSTRSSSRSPTSSTRRRARCRCCSPATWPSSASRCWSPAWSPAGSAPSARCCSGLVLIIVFSALAGSSDTRRRDRRLPRRLGPRQRAVHRHRAGHHRDRRRSGSVAQAIILFEAALGLGIAAGPLVGGAARLDLLARPVLRRRRC